MMKKGLKIVTIGGGSSYTPELMEGFIKRQKELGIREIWLVDVEAGKEKLEIVGALAQRMWDAADYDVTIHCTLDRKKALQDADFVTTQFRVGQLEARMKDERIPYSYGVLGQETNGAGGIFKALRTIPVILDIVKDMKEICPHAWLINFTNPSGMVTEAVVKHGGWERCIGLCNVPVIAMQKEYEAIGCRREDLVYQYAGLNHFHWHKVYDRLGNDVSGQIIEAMLSGKDVGLPANIADISFFKEQLRQMNMIPCGYHRYYYQAEEMLEHGLKEYEMIGTRAEQVKETEETLFTLYKNEKLHEKPEELARRGGAFYSDAACECISAIYNNKHLPMVVSTRNNGAISDIHDDSIVEVTSYITAKGAMPVAWGAFDSAQRGWLQCMKAMEECTIEAAIHGDYGQLLQAFQLNPLIPNGATGRRIMDELLLAHKAYLPQFIEEIKRLERVGITIKDDKARALCE